MLRRYIWIIITYTIAQLSSFPIAILLSLYVENNTQYISLVVGWQIISFVIALIITALLLKPERNLERHPEAASGTMTVIWSILGVVMAMFGQMIANLIQQFIFNIEPQSENTMQIMEIARAIPLFIIVVTIIGPILEEIIFRKIIFGELYKRTNFLIAGLVSGFIFAIIHMDFSHLLVYFVMSFVFAFIYVQSKRIIVPIIAHVVMNTIVVIVQFNIDPAELEQMLEQVQLILIGG